MSDSRPEIALDLRAAARFLVETPLVIAEKEPDMFRLIRRHGTQLDRWFTQRFGYRLQITADTARLFKSTVVARRRPLRTVGNARPFSQREYKMLALALAAVSAGPGVISLRHLITEIRSAASEAGVAVSNEALDRRALVTALKWMIDCGVASERHERLDQYVTDEQADALLAVRPERVALLVLPVLAGSESAEQVVDRSGQRQSARAWMRAMLLEEPVVYRDDLAESEWAELRRRLGQETDIFEEMFGMHIEARAEGLAAIDPDGALTDSRFPAGGTVAQAALLLLDRLIAMEQNPVERSVVVGVVASLSDEHQRHWSQLAKDPDRLTDAIFDLLIDHRLAERAHGGIRLLPAAWRYAVEISVEQLSLL